MKKKSTTPRYAFMMVQLIVKVYETSTVAKDYLHRNLDRWSWMPAFAKRSRCSPRLTEMQKVQYRDMKKIPSINTLCSIRGAPTLTEELSEGNTSFKVDGAQHAFVNGEYTFRAYFDGVPYYQKCDDDGRKVSIFRYLQAENGQAELVFKHHGRAATRHRTRC